MEVDTEEEEVDTWVEEVVEVSLLLLLLLEEVWLSLLLVLELLLLSLLSLVG